MRKLKIITTALVLSIAFGMTVFAQVKVPPMNIKQRTLSNGLRVVTLQDNSNPTVAIHVWYDVGGKNDPEGRSGFAHMFEHMMFKSTKNMPNEKMDRLTEDVGGFNNASTREDYTNYYEVVPSNYLESLLWAEAERMQNLNVDEANFASERDVVKEEFRQSVLDPPYGRLYQFLDSLSFEKHPYQRGVIGNLDELTAATTKDANQFYKTFYRPDNAVLIVVGDFQEKQLSDWVDKYFGKVKKPEAKIPRVTVAEPQWTKERRFNQTGPIVPFPATAIIYKAPVSKSEDVPVLRLVENILSGGESSRLYQGMIREQQIAQEASFYADIRVDPGLLFFLGIAAQGHTSAEMEKAFLAELKKMQEKPVSAQELEKAKNQLITDTLRRRENNDGKAIAIEQAIAYQGDPLAVNSDIKRLQAVTPADIQRVMKKYFADNNRVVIYYDQEKKEGDSK
ncbi:MAG: pitrilysin family protein [Pyrinomonadaceae bacterium]